MGMRRRLIDALFRRRPSRQIWKLKSLLNLTVSRISVLSNQRNARCSHARSDIIQLLLLGQQDRALIRAELLIKEQNTVDVFAMVESYCHLLNDRAFLLGQQKECPEELKEAAAGLSYAASRCGDLPELQQVREILSSRFGRDFTAAAVELRSNCGVDAKMVQKFSATQPSLESRINVMKEIAMERGVELELITNHFAKVEEMITPHLDSACYGDDKVKMGAQEYNDVVSAAQAAFESASYAAVAAKAAVELYRSEAEMRGSCNENSCNRKEPEKMQRTKTAQWRLQEQEMNLNIPRNYSPLASRSSFIDNGFHKRSTEMELERPGEEEILPKSRSETVSRVGSYRELTSLEVQAKVQFHGEHKIEASYPNLTHQKRRPSKDGEDADSFSSDSEMEVEISSFCSSPGKNLASHFSAMS